MRLSEPTGPYDHVIGRATAPVELVEYGDYECASCARAHHEMTEVLRKAGEHVRYSFRHFPLAWPRPRALLAAQAAEAAGAQGRFWHMHSVLFENRHALDEDDLLVYAEIVGLDVRRFSRELRAGTHLARVQRDRYNGVRSGVDGTPAFFVDGVRQERWDAASLERAIRSAAAQRTPSLAQR